jgi:O-antigen ligase/Tfp pilus assembly protein PilF
MIPSIFWGWGILLSLLTVIPLAWSGVAQAIKPALSHLGASLLVLALWPTLLRRGTATSLVAPVVTLWGVAALSTVVGAARIGTYRALYELTATMAIFLAASRLVTNRATAASVARTVATVGALASLIVWHQFLRPASPRFWGPTEIPFGTMGNSNFMGALLAGALPLALALAIEAARPLARNLAAVASLLVGSALLLTRSRGAWIAAAVGLAAFGLLLRHAERRPRGAGRVLALALAAAAVAAVALSVEERGPVGHLASILDPGYTTNAQRLAWWSDALRISRDHPVLGAGLGGFAEAHPPYHSLRDPQVAARYVILHPHNDWVWFAAEVGLAGLGALAWLAARAARLARDALAATPMGEGRALVAGLVASLVAFSTNATFVSVLFQPGTDVVFWTLLAGLPACAREPDGAPPARAPIAPAPRAERRVAGKTGAWVLAIGLAFAFWHWSLGAFLGNYFYHLARHAYARPDGLEAGAALLRRAQAWDPDLFNPGYELATIYRERGDLNSAYGQIAGALVRHPTYLLGYTLLAEIEQGAGRPHRAAAAYARALALNPAYPPALTGLAAFHLAAGEDHRAGPLLARALILYPSLAAPYLLESRLAERRGDRSAALSAVRAATTAAPRDPEAWFARARLAERLGEAAEAWDALGRAVGLDRRIGVAAAKEPVFARYLEDERFRGIVGLRAVIPLASPRPPRDAADLPASAAERARVPFR